MAGDRFERCHPAVSLLFFAAAIVFGCIFMHPVYSIVGMLSSAVYYALLAKRKSIKTFVFLLVIFVVVTAINPLLNTTGNTVLFYVAKRPYTQEALLYGGCLAAIAVTVILWAACLGKIMTDDKFTALFARLAPSLSLLFVMVLRLVPAYFRKAGQLSDARMSIGKGTKTGSKKQNIIAGTTILSCLTSWALESGVETADSMRSRGYGAGKRTSYRLFVMKAGDWIILAAVGLCIIALIFIAAKGGTSVNFTPVYEAAKINGICGIGAVIYLVLLWIPIFLHIKEEAAWHILRSKI